jgi:hypothetical protein
MATAEDTRTPAEDGGIKKWEILSSVRAILASVRRRV